MNENTEIIPLVSINCLVYNHEPYLHDCFDGFIMQETNFPIEILVHDDASTDCSAEIIKEYTAKYPDLFKPIYQTENQYSKRDGTIGRLQHDRAKGIYIAYCEGDDYWTDPLKLQKQVDFLEKNEEYSMCFHHADVITESNRLDTSIYNHLEDRDYNSDELLLQWTVPTASMLARNEVINLQPISSKFTYGDIVIVLTCAEHGKVKCLNQKMSVYRRHEKGIIAKVNVKPVDHSLELIDHYLEIRNYFQLISEKTISILVLSCCVSCCFSLIKNKRYALFMYYFLKYIKKYKGEFLKFFYSKAVLKIKNLKISTSL